MQFSSKLTIATHVLLAIEQFDGQYKTTSEFLASSVNVNPVIIRNMLGALQKAGFIETKAGVGGSVLAKNPREITLKGILLAVEKDTDLFRFHENPNPNCPVGRNIHGLLIEKLDRAREAMLADLDRTTLADLYEELQEKIRLQETAQ